MSSDVPFPIVEHPSDEHIEDYARYAPGHAPWSFDDLEKHLLWCGYCQHRVSEADRSIKLIRECCITWRENRQSADRISPAKADGSDEGPGLPIPSQPCVLPRVRTAAR